MSPFTDSIARNIRARIGSFMLDKFILSWYNHDIKSIFLKFVSFKRCGVQLCKTFT